MSTPAESLAKSGWIERNESGKAMERPATCECGREYTQFKIAFRFVEALAQGRGERAANLFVKQIPDGWVPVFCPSCESRELGRLANRVTYPPEASSPKPGAAA